MMSMYFIGMTALVAPRMKEASGGWKSTSAPTFCSRSAMSPRVPLARPTRIMTMATSMATASTETAVRVLRCITLAAARLAMKSRRLPDVDAPSRAARLGEPRSKGRALGISGAAEST